MPSLGDVMRATHRTWHSAAAAGAASVFMLFCGAFISLLPVGVLIAMLVTDVVVEVIVVFTLSITMTALFEGLHDIKDEAPP